jgi:hypothetical protein
MNNKIFFFPQFLKVLKFFDQNYDENKAVELVETIFLTVNRERFTEEVADLICLKIH